jgi:hypothetical protein
VAQDKAKRNGVPIYLKGKDREQKLFQGVRTICD